MIVLVDLIVRCFEFRLHYSPLGILPRIELLKTYYDGFPSIHLLSDLWCYQIFIFCVHGLIAIALCLGYRTRITSVLAWYFQLSLTQKNYLLNNGGDMVIVDLLFWAMFVPWGTYWSLDALARDPDQERPETVFSAGSACLVGQVVLIYWVSVFHKMEPTWLSGQAIYYAFLSDLYSRPSRELLMPFPDLMRFMTYGALAFEMVGPLLLLSPRPRVRVLGALMFTIMHMGFGFFLRLGTFAFAPIANFVALLPATAWSGAWVQHYRKRCEPFMRKLNRWLGTPRPAPYPPLGLGWSTMLGALYLYSVLEGLGNTNTAKPNPYVIPQIRWIGVWTGLNQRWCVFVNLPKMLDGCVLLQGKLADDSTVDLFQGREPFTWEKPISISATHDHFRWPTPLLQIVSSKALQRSFVQALVSDWDDHHPPARRVLSARLYFLSEASLASYRDAPLRSMSLYDWAPPR